MKLLRLCLALLIAGFARFPQTSSSAAAALADETFVRLTDAYLDGYLTWRPQRATALGLHQYDGEVTDFRAASLRAELARLKAFERRLADLDTKALNPTNYYAYRILRGAVEREIFSFEDMQAYTRNPMTYADVLDVNIYIKRDFAPLEMRVARVTRILSQAPTIMAAARKNLVASLPRPQTETAIEQAEGAADFLARELVAAFKNIRNPTLMTAFTTANTRAISELRGYANFLRRQKLPAANDNYALGREKYRRLLQCGEQLTCSPEELLEIGRGELRRQQDAFAETARQINPNAKPIDVFHAIQRDHPTAQNLISDTAKHLEAIRTFLEDHNLITIPSPVRAQVTETPQFLRATTFASMDTPGPFETKATEAYYYVTPPERDWPPKQTEEWLTAFNYFTTDIVSVHEAYPGHYVQYLCLNASPATVLEKVFVSYAFSEGWAHYAEQMMIEEGFGADRSASPSREEQVRAAKYRLAQIDEALLRLCRLCASIQIHCQGMTVAAATKFFQDNCYYEEKTARSEAVRGVYDPEYLYYTLGKLEILKLRQDFQKQEGASFSLRRFHDDLLRHGAPPIRLLREVLLKDPAQWPETLAPDTSQPR